MRSATIAASRSSLAANVSAPLKRPKSGVGAGVGSVAVSVGTVTVTAVVCVVGGEVIVTVVVCVETVANSVVDVVAGMRAVGGALDPTPTVAEDSSVRSD